MIFGDRKTGCRFYEFTFYGYRSLLIENDRIRTVLLLDKGTDILSFVDKATDTEYVWTNPMGLSCLEKIRKADMDSDCYTDNYPGGWFEILPNVGGECRYEGKHFIGHGEAAYLPWDYTVLEDSAEQIRLLFVTRLSKFPFELRKTLTVRRTEPTLHFEQEVVNLGEKPLAYLWGYHPNVGMPFLSADCDIELPFAAGPIAMPPVGSGEESLTVYREIDRPFGAIRNRKTGIGIGFAWDPAMYRHCILWINAGTGEGHHHHGGAYVACILPTSSPVMGLDEAAAAGCACLLDGHATAKTRFTVTAFCKETPVSDIRLDGTVL